MSRLLDQHLGVSRLLHQVLTATLLPEQIKLWHGGSSPQQGVYLAGFQHTFLSINMVSRL